MRFSDVVTSHKAVKLWIVPVHFTVSMFRELFLFCVAFIIMPPPPLRDGYILRRHDELPSAGSSRCIRDCSSRCPFDCEVWEWECSVLQSLVRPSCAIRIAQEPNVVCNRIRLLRSTRFPRCDIRDHARTSAARLRLSLSLSLGRFTLIKFTIGPPFVMLNMIGR